MNQGAQFSPGNMSAGDFQSSSSSAGGVNSAQERLLAFSKLGHRLCSARTQRDAIKIILDIADTFFGWDACTFDSYSEAEDAVSAVIVVDRIGDERVDVEPVVRNQKPTRRMRQVIEEGPLLILRKPPIQMPSDAVPMGDQSRPSASLLYVPVRSCDRVIGLLSIQSYTPDAYSVEDLETLQSLADHGAGALERIQAEEKMQQLNRELEDRIAERTAALAATVGELEAFSYSVSHDMRAPLRAMHGYAQILVEQYPGKVLDETAVDYLSRIARSAVRMDLLIQDVLSYTKVLRGHVTLEPVDMEGLIADVIDAHPQWRSSKASIEVIGRIPKVVGNEALLMQCVSNLLSNAIKFVVAGAQPHVKIRPEQIGNNVTIWFEDNGIGIAPEDHGRIFRMFERIHPAAEFEGTGIGLTIVRKAVERLNGQVGFKSTPGQGSKFWMQLPKATE
ncbi:MAG TPA: ATP-binding protein [Verrucomicrobiae bacterium]|nr:ATP-binding protein [Verrucomicrobiae bacterium]